MTDDEKDSDIIHAILAFSISLRARTIIGVSITLIMVCLVYVIPYFIPKLWTYILNALSKVGLTH